MKYYVVESINRKNPFYISPYSFGYQLVDIFGNLCYWKFVYKPDGTNRNDAVFPSCGYDFVCTSFEDKRVKYTVPAFVKLNEENPDESIERLQKLMVLK